MGSRVFIDLDEIIIKSAFDLKPLSVCNKDKDEEKFSFQQLSETKRASLWKEK